jgi:transposase-like protein
MNVNELAQELGVTRRCLYKWRVKLETIELGEDDSRPSTHASAQRKEILQLKRLLAEKAMEVDFLKGVLQKIEARRQRSSGSGGKASTNTSEK